MNKITPPAPRPRQITDTGTDWDVLATVTDEEIARAVANDPDAAPILSEEQMRQQYKSRPPRIRR